MTAMRSLPSTVESRWAMTMLVRPFMRCASESWMSASDSLSSALVASSRMRMRGSARKARAMAMRCFWPPESLQPRSPSSDS